MPRRDNHKKSVKQQAAPLADLLSAVPRLLDFLHPGDLGRLMATSSQLHSTLRRQVSGACFEEGSSRTGLDLQILHQLPTLRKLTLHAEELTQEQAQQIKRMQWPLLSWLDVSGCCLPAKAMWTLSRGKWPLLQHLNLSTHLGKRGMAYLVTGKFPQLATLILDDADIDAKAVAALGDADWPCLGHLSLAHNRVSLVSSKTTTCNRATLGTIVYDGEMAVAHALASCKCPQLTYLDLGLNSTGRSQMDQLATCHWPHLKHLYRSYFLCNNLDFLCNAAWPQLVHLDLQRTLLSWESIVAIA